MLSWQIPSEKPDDHHIRIVGAKHPDTSTQGRLDRDVGGGERPPRGWPRLFHCPAPSEQHCGEQRRRRERCGTPYPAAAHAASRRGEDRFVRCAPRRCTGERPPELTLRLENPDRKSTRLNSSHVSLSRMP